jgi:hypothetical protein
MASKTTPQRTTRTSAGKKATKPSKAQSVRDQFDKGASLTEAAKATGVDPAYVWDLAAIWEKTSGRTVPRNGRSPKAAEAPAVATTPRRRHRSVTK